MTTTMMLKWIWHQYQVKMHERASTTTMKLPGKIFWICWIILLRCEWVENSYSHKNFRVLRMWNKSRRQSFRVICRGDVEDNFMGKSWRVRLCLWKWIAFRIKAKIRSLKDYLKLTKMISWCWEGTIFNWNRLNHRRDSENPLEVFEIY